MNAIRTHPAHLARKTSLALLTFAILNLAVIPLLLGCDGPHPVLGSANASPATARSSPSGDVAAEAPQDVYLPRRHQIQRDATHGNVATYERD